MADAKLTLAFDTAGALASLTSFMGKAKSILQTPLVPSAGVGTARGLEDAFGNLVKTKSGLDGVAKSAGSTLLALTGIGTGVALFHQLTSAISEAADAQVAMNTALKSFDVSTLTSTLSGLNTQLDRMVQLQETAGQRATSFKQQTQAVAASFLLAAQGAREFVTGQTPEEDAVRARARLLANIDFEEGQKQRKLLAASAATRFQSLQFTQSDLLQRGDLAGAERNARVIEEQQQEATRLAREALKADQERRRSGLLQVAGATPESVEITFKKEILNLDADLALSGQRRQQQNQRAIEDLRQLVTETANLREQLERDRVTQGAVAEAEEQERQARRRSLELETVGQLREAERGLTQEIADAQGRILNDITETNAARRDQAIATARAEVEAIQAATTARLQGLGGRLGASQGQLEALSGLPSTPEVEKRRIALLSQMQEIQGQITEAARKGAADRAAVEIKAAGELRQLAIKEAADRVALLRKTLAQENQLRTEARNLLGQALGNLGTRPGDLPIDEFSTSNLAQLEEETARQRAEDEATLRDARLGREFNVRQLQGALGRRGFQEQLGQFGGLRSALDIAGTTPGTVPGQLTGAEQFAQAQEEIATLSKQVADSIAGVKGTFADSLGQVPGLMQSTMDELVAIVDTGKSKLGASLADMVQGQLTRAFADAQRRM